MSMLRPDTAASTTPDDRSADGTLPVHQKLDDSMIGTEASNSNAEKANASAREGGSAAEKHGEKRGMFPWSKRPGTSASTDSESSTDEKKRTGQDMGTIAVAKDVQLPPVGFLALFT
jgi:hypothetical protein